MNASKIISNWIIRPQLIAFNKLILRPFSNNLEAPLEVQLNDESSYTKLKPFSPVEQVQSVFIENLSPPSKRSFNLAAYVNNSKTLQKLIELGVSLYDIENTNNIAAKYYLTLDFERDCLKHIKFLIDNGLKEDNLGRFLSEFPMIFHQPIDDLEVRLNYLESKGFSKKMIAKALNRSSHIISHKTKTMDFKMGQLQIEFKLRGSIVRSIITKLPELIALPETQFKLTNFTLSEEFGFKNHEIHKLLDGQPNLIVLERPVLIERLDLVHNKIGLSHQMIVKFPKLITGPRLDISHRYQYLEKLGRNQFNPRKPLYVRPSALYNLSDEDFCSRYAKTTLEDYKLFLRSR